MQKHTNLLLLSKLLKLYNLICLLLLGTRDFLVRRSSGRWCAAGSVDRSHVSKAHVKAIVLLANGSKIKTSMLLVLLNSNVESGNAVHDHKSNGGNTKRPRQNGSRAGELVSKLNIVVVHPSTGNGGSVKSSNIVCGKEASQARANPSANSVESKHIETVVDSEEMLEGSGVVAANSGDDSNGNGSVNGNETGGRSDTDKTSNGTRAHADSGPSSVKADIVEEEPGHGTNTGSQVGVDKGISSSNGSVTGRTTVESKPAKPEENGAKDGGGDRVRLEHWEALALGIGVVSLSANKSIGKGTGTRRHVDGATSGIVKATKDSDPASCAPGPAGDGSVDNGHPDEEEDHHRAETGTFVSTANHDHTSDGGEHALVKAKENIRDKRNHAGGAEHIHETKVVEFTEEGATIVGKDEGVAPEEPLKANETASHDTCPQQRDGVLFSRETRVEEADAGDHDPDEGGRGHDPGHASEVELRVEVGGERVTASANTGQAVGCESKTHG